MMTDNPIDETQLNLDQAAAEKAVLEKVTGEWREAWGFNMATYAQDIYAQIGHEVRMDRSLTGRTQEELERETNFRTTREERAIRGMTAAEAEVCHLLGVRPSEYVLYKKSE